MKDISNSKKGGGYMPKENDKVSIVQTPIPTGQQIAQMVNKLTLKWNAKSLLEQETSETLQGFITTVMSTLNAYEIENKELKEKLSKYDKEKK